MLDLTVRLAEPKDAEALQALSSQVSSCAKGLNIDWTKAWPFWLIATRDEELLGMIQVLPARPFGHIEMLLMEPSLRDRDKARVGGILIKHAVESLRQQGVQFACGMIDDGLDGYLHTAEKRGWEEVAHGHLMMARL